MEQAKQEAFDHTRLQVIKDGYEKAFACINKGLTEDEVGHSGEALKLYQQGQQHLLRALSVPSHGMECVGPSWESARQMQHKMQETLNNITARLGMLETSSDPNGVSDSSAAPQKLYPEVLKVKPERPAPPQMLASNSRVAGVSSGPVPVAPSMQLNMLSNQPPAYTPQAADGHLTVSYGTDSGELSLVGDEFYSLTSNSTTPPQCLGEDGEELFFLPQGVQIFLVTPEGQVSAPSYPGYLRIVKFTSERSERIPNRPPAFLQVCGWLYPLMASDSPVLLCNTGVYMFPDMMAPTPGLYVGVVLSSELPQKEHELFQSVLSQLTDLHVQASDGTTDTINLGQKVPMGPPAAEEEKVLPEWSGKVAQGVLTGASRLSWGLVKGAEYTGKAIHKGAAKLREHIAPEDKPAQVSPTIAKSLHVTKQATGGAVKVSQFLVDGLCTVTGHVGRELAPHVKKHGGKLIPESLKKDKDGCSKIDGAMVVAASGVQGFATVWTGLEVAAKNIAKSVAAETVTTVKHKYGAEAGQATDHAVNSAINVGVTAFNIDNLGIKAVVKKTGKETARAILADYKVQEPSSQVEKHKDQK
ncbi:spartin b [Carassius gibelio]|uniref:spartin b n=1 Tax=Carassius gibelio TaxID=101364 RepID=UPI0022787A5A|nr:spartin b [Carassius gibelio]